MATISGGGPTAESDQPPRRCADCPIRPLALFEPFSEEEVTEVSRIRNAVRFVDARAEIDGKERGELYTLFWGWAFRAKILDDGARQILDILLPGDFIGLESLAVEDPDIRVEAITPVSLCVFPRQRILKAMQENTKLALSLSRLATQSEVTLFEHLADLGRRKSEHRIAHFALEMYTRMERRGQVRDNTSPFPLTQSIIADCLGLTTEHVNRALRSLRDGGLMTIRGRKLEVLDYDGLANLASWSDRYLMPRPLI